MISAGERKGRIIELTLCAPVITTQQSTQHGHQMQGY